MFGRLDRARCGAPDVIGARQAFDDTKYPDFKGQWDRFIVRGINGQFDQTKPTARPAGR